MGTKATHELEPGDLVLVPTGERVRVTIAPPPGGELGTFGYVENPQDIPVAERVGWVESCYWLAGDATWTVADVATLDEVRAELVEVELALAAHVQRRPWRWVEGPEWRVWAALDALAREVGRLVDLVDAHQTGGEQ